MKREVSTVMAFSIILALSIGLAVIADRMQKSIPEFANEISTMKK